jgi:type II secretory pathway predicted ATPase ExeA
MNKEQEKLVDEAYNNFIKKTKGLNLFLEVNKDIVAVEGPVYNAHPKLLTQEEFINKCKTDTEFSEKWGLTIEERELSLEKRRKIVLEGDPHGIQSTDNWTQQQLEDCKKQLDEWNIPTKQITIAYNDKTIESYE